MQEDKDTVGQRGQKARMKLENYQRMKSLSIRTSNLGDREEKIDYGKIEKNVA